MKQKIVTLTSLNLYLSVRYGILFIKHELGICYLFLPSFFFFKLQKNSLNLIFIHEFFYKTFMTTFFERLKLQYFFFIKLRVRGLGYRLWSICDTFHYSFFNYTIIIIFLVQIIWL